MEQERAMNALNHIDPALIEAADLPEKRRKPRWVRMVLTAACICVVLLGAAYAVEQISGLWLTDFHYGRTDGPDGGYDGYRIYGGVELLAVDSLPEEVITLAQENAGEDFIRLEFSSLNAAEDFLGLNLQDNSVLEGLRQRNIVSMDPLVFTDHCVMSMAPGAEGPISFYISANYTWEGSENDTVFLSVEEVIYTELVPFLSEEAWSEPIFHAGSEFERLEYVTPSGLETIIVRIDPDREDRLYDRVLYRAYFSLNGARFELESKSVSEEENPEQALAVLQEILDGFF